VPGTSSSPEGKADRAPFNGVFLTHAHMGHYLGLAHFGFESLNANAMPVWASARMAEYLQMNGPWSQLVRLKNIELREMQPGTPVSIGEGVTVSGFPVPHRDEYSDTLAFPDPRPAEDPPLRSGHRHLEDLGAPVAAGHRGGEGRLRPPRRHLLLAR